MGKDNITSGRKSNGKSGTKEKAMAARLQAEKSEKRRENVVRIGIAAVVIVIVAGIIGAALYSSKSSKNDGNNSSIPVSTALPNGVPKDNPGFTVGTNAKAPELVIFEDFQCPACKNFEITYGKNLTELANSGKLRVTYYPMSMLDSRLENNASQIAASAFGSAIDAGKGEQYHAIVYANQPEEGVGYTKDQLKEYGKQAGITGPEYDRFATSVDNLTYSGWSTMSNNQAAKYGVHGTPSLFVNGQEVPRTSFTSINTLIAEINKLAQTTGTPTPLAS